MTDAPPRAGSGPGPGSDPGATPCAHPRAGLFQRVLEALVNTNPLSSYTRIGYRVRSRAFDPADLAVDLTGRIALITGANSGIGFVTARELARRGAQVFMLCRDAGRASQAADRIRADVANARLETITLDVGRLAAVREVAAALTVPRVDILIHNAAILPAERSLTGDGLEQALATNLVGPYLLTELLKPGLVASEDARLVLVSSGGMYPRRLDVSTLHHTSGPYDGVTAYADTKRALVELGEHLAHALPAQITVSAMHPGWADTPGVARSLPVFHTLSQLLLRSPEVGADTVIWLAASPRARGRTGLFWLDREPRPTHVFPWTRTPPGERAALIEALRRWTK